MSDLISGKEALIALANGEEVLYIGKTHEHCKDRIWGDAKEVEVSDFLHDSWSFKLKPKTISLNGISIPAPFEPKEGERYWYISNNCHFGYSSSRFQSVDCDARFTQFGAWRTEDEIKQVVEALKNIFKGVK